MSHGPRMGPTQRRLLNDYYAAQKPALIGPPGLPGEPGDPGPSALNLPNLPMKSADGKNWWDIWCVDRLITTDATETVLWETPSIGEGRVWGIRADVQVRYPDASDAAILRIDAAVCHPIGGELEVCAVGNESRIGKMKAQIATVSFGLSGQKVRLLARGKANTTLWWVANIFTMWTGAS